MVMLPPRRILSSWIATEYCVTPNVPQKLLIVYDGYFCSTDSFGAMSLLPKVMCTQSVKTWIAQWEWISTHPGQQGATETYSHPFCAWSEPATVGCYKHPCLAGFCSLPSCQVSPQVAAPSKRNPAPVTCQAPSRRLQKHWRIHPDPPLLSRLKPCQAWAPKVTLSSVENADICNSSPPLQTSGEERG